MKYKLMVRNGLEVYFGLSMPGDDRLNIGVKDVGLQFEYFGKYDSKRLNSASFIIFL